MWLHQAELGLLNVLLLPSLVSSISLDCGHVRTEGQSFNFKSLEGPHSVQYTRNTPPTIRNTTYTIDLCAGLRIKKDMKNEDQCPGNTRVCGIEYDYNSVTGTESIAEVIPIAGEFALNHGLALDPKYKRLKTSESHADADREGVRITLHGGRYPNERKGVKQKLILEMLCDRNRTGLEGDLGDGRVPPHDNSRTLTARSYSEDDDDEGKDPEDGGDDEDDGDGDDEEDQDKDRSLRYVSYGNEGDGKNEMGVLRLEWRTKWACEGMADQNDDGTDDDDNEDKNKHWGFFTWFIIVLFLAIAAYLIFGSWLNYNRYGARGWDLLPHGDTIRDIPYIVKDWGRKVVNAIQGPGSRGGYSAV